MPGKRKPKIKKNSLFFFVGIIIAAVLVGAVFFDFGKALAQAVSGWAKGVWNDTIGHDAGGNDLLSGIPTIGWLSSTSRSRICNNALSQKYSVNLGGEDGKVDRPVTGLAWFGVGSQPDNIPAGSENDPSIVCQSDLPSLGWLNFDAGFPSFCSSLGLKCQGATWHKKNGGEGFEGTIDGWAKIDSMMQMPKPDGTKADNGWVELKDIQVDKDGMSTGWAWNSGEETTSNENSGLGWLKLDGMMVGNCKIGCATKKLCKNDSFPNCDVSFCTGDPTLSCDLASGGTSWTCNNDCGSKSCDTILWLEPETGACGQLNGKSICSSEGEPSADKLCADPKTFNGDLNLSGITATWSCGKDQCGVNGRVECSASARCGWIETQPSN